MIHIKRSTDKKYYVTVVGDNGEVLSTSETLNSKQQAWKNIHSLMVSFNAKAWIRVIDYTNKRPIKYLFSVAGEKVKMDK